jgi:hypothetical protein
MFFVKTLQLCRSAVVASRQVMFLLMLFEKMINIGRQTFEFVEFATVVGDSTSLPGGRRSGGGTLTFNINRHFATTETF